MSSEPTFQDVQKAVLILLGFVLLSVIWDPIFFYFVRNKYLRIQRWKSYSKIQHRLELLWCLKNKATTSFPSAEGTNGCSKVPYSERVNLEDYAPSLQASRFEVCNMPRIVFVPSTSGIQTSPMKAVETVWSEKKKNRPFTAGWFRNCFGCKKEKPKGPRYGGPATGYSFRGHNWIPKKLESRKLSKYLRGNFLNLLGGLVSVGFLITGALMAMVEAGMTFNGALTGTSLLAVAAVLRLPEFFTDILSYFKIVRLDVVERGDLIEVLLPNSALGTARGEGLIGGVLNIDWSYVHLVVIDQNDDDDRELSDHERILDNAGGLKTIEDLATKKPGGKPSDVPKSKPSDAPKPSSKRTESEVSNSKPPGYLRTYVEKDYTRVFSNSRIPISIFAECVIKRKTSWAPVASLSRISTEFDVTNIFSFVVLDTSELINSKMSSSEIGIQWEGQQNKSVQVLFWYNLVHLANQDAGERGYYPLSIDKDKQKEIQNEIRKHVGMGEHSPFTKTLNFVKELASNYDVCDGEALCKFFAEQNQ